MAAALPQESPRRIAASGVSADMFKAAFRRHPGGVALVTADAGTGPVALTATSVFSVSVDPHLLVMSVSGISSSSPVLTTADTMVVHLLDARNVDLAKLGATSGIDRFADTRTWTRLETGEPLFHAVPTWVRGRVVNRFATGTATVIVLEAVEVGVPEDERDASPLVYHNRTWHRLSADSVLDGHR